jgi:hypothetical protein
MESDNAYQIGLLNLLAARLEHLSVDSHWARRASGLRGNIIKVLEEAQAGRHIDQDRLDLLIGTAFNLLRRAAQDIPDIEAFLKQFERGDHHHRADLN